MDFQPQTPSDFNFIPESTEQDNTLGIWLPFDGRSTSKAWGSEDSSPSVSSYQNIKLEGLDFDESDLASPFGSTNAWGFSPSLDSIDNSYGSNDTEVPTVKTSNKVEFAVDSNCERRKKIRREQNRKSQRKFREKNTKKYDDLLERFLVLKENYEILEKDFAASCFEKAGLKMGLEAILNALPRDPRVKTN